VRQHFGDCPTDRGSDVRLWPFGISTARNKAATSYRYLVNFPGVCQVKTSADATPYCGHDVVGLIISLGITGSNSLSSGSAKPGKSSGRAADQLWSDIDAPSKTDHSFSETLPRWAQTLLELVCPQPESGKNCRIWHLLDLAWPLVRGGVDSFPVRSDDGVASGRASPPVGRYRQGITANNCDEILLVRIIVSR